MYNLTLHVTLPDATHYMLKCLSSGTLLEPIKQACLASDSIITTKNRAIISIDNKFFACNWQALKGKFCTWNHNAFLNETWMKLLKLTVKNRV